MNYPFSEDLFMGSIAERGYLPSLVWVRYDVFLGRVCKGFIQSSLPELRVIFDLRIIWGRITILIHRKNSNLLVL